MSRSALVAAAVVALAFPASAPARTLHGTVVHHVPRAHSFVIATHAGHLRAIHSMHAPGFGRVVSVQARRLGNGTFAAGSVHVRRAHRRHARLRGTITHVNRRTRAFVLSARGTSLLIHRRSGARSADSLREGEKAVVDTTLTSDDELEADDVRTLGPATRFEVEGVVQTIDTTAGTLTVSADDDEASGASLVVHFPAGSDLSGFHVGNEVELVVTGSADGTLTAVSGSTDEDEGDNDQGEDRGDDDGVESEDHQFGDHESGDGEFGGEGGSDD